MCLYSLLLLLLRVIFEWLRLIGVSAYAALVIVIRGRGAPVCFLTVIASLSNYLQIMPIFCYKKTKQFFSSQKKDKKTKLGVVLQLYNHTQLLQCSFGSLFPPYKQRSFL